MANVETVKNKLMDIISKSYYDKAISGTNLTVSDIFPTDNDDQICIVLRDNESDTYELYVATVAAAYLEIL
jgi:hypothetical protein